MDDLIFHIPLRPNEGFVTQLHLYGDINFDVSVNRTEYRRFLIANMAAHRESKT